MKSFLYQNYILNQIQHPNHDIIGLEKKCKCGFLGNNIIMVMLYVTSILKLDALSYLFLNISYMFLSHTQVKNISW